MTARAYVRFVLQYGRWIWLLALALGLPAAQRTASLYARLDADFEQLLPRDAAGAPPKHTLQDLYAHFSGGQALEQHRALADVRTNAQVLERLLELSGERKGGWGWGGEWG